MNRLIPIVHGELRKIAACRLKEEPGAKTLISPTVLVNEAYLKLVKYRPNPDRPWHHRAEFFVLASKIMFNILVDYSRKKKGAKHGGGLVKITLEEAPALMAGAVDVILLDEVLSKMAGFAPRQSNIWKCRYIGGLSIDEISHAFHLAPSTIHKELKAANGWVHHQLRELR